ncbi:MAG: GGDEF domain-containing protein [Gemmatimonadota bacterium]|nr:GGDEF domain-containing protein [Gemmatimonadota bacterium]
MQAEPGSIRSWLGFGLGGREPAFQQDALASDLARAKIAVAGVAVGFCLISLADLWLAGSLLETTARELVSGGFLLLSVLVYRALDRSAAPRRMDWLLLGWQFAGVATFLVHRAARLPAIEGATIVFLAFGAYAVLPSRLLFRFLPTMLLTGGDLLLQWLVLGMAPRILVGSVLAYLFVNLAGVFSAAGFLAMRRRHFLARNESRNRQEELEQRANTDGLTGVLRRGRWLELAEAELSRFLRHERPFAILITDLDDFKRVNDAYGHLAGDLVLRHFADLLRRQSRPFDLVGRIGGEEFGVLLPETDLVAAHDMADRIVRSCRELVVTVPGADLQITCSVGLTVAAAGDRAIPELLARADGAMYAAKVGGRDRVEVAVRPAPDHPESPPTQ